MSRIRSVPDDTAPLAMKLLAAVNLLFFLSFLALLMAATDQAAAAPACTGQDMTAELERRDPVAFKRIRAEADATPNGKRLLWKLEKEGAAPSWLFGTMHMTDPRLTRLTPAAQAAFDQAGTVVIETTELLDQSKMMAALASEPGLMMFTDDTTLASLLPPEDVAATEAALTQRGIPLASVAKMKPWILAAMVALPECEMARKAEGLPVLDIKLAKDAQAAGKKLEGLETVADQLRAMASLPMDFHIKGLVETLKLGDRMEDVVETMVLLYDRQETGMFWPLFRAVLPSDTDDLSGYAAFEETIIKARNRTMTERVLPILDDGSAFVAVGALHLPGEDGLVELLRQAGYTATAQ